MRQLQFSSRELELSISSSELLSWSCCTPRVLFLLCCIAEALHLASLLCYYGYFFHITTNGAVQIKEDNELFRFQAPYYWVSTNWTTGNIEYGLLKTRLSFLFLSDNYLYSYLFIKTNIKKSTTTWS